MRLYYFTGPQFALENIRERRLKVSFLTEVNDLFELRPFEFQDRKHRIAWGLAIKQHAKHQGFISFCANWSVPTMWAHYANNHQGVCYGFDVTSTTLTPIDYKDKLKPFDVRVLKDEQVNACEVEYASKTKSSHWEYEEEWRQYVSLDEKECSVRSRGGLVFLPFSENLNLRKVIIGARSSLTSAEIFKAHGATNDLEVETARPSFREFKMVPQKLKGLQK